MINLILKVMLICLKIFDFLQTKKIKYNIILFDTEFLI
jgi:hypothetical protein